MTVLIGLRGATLGFGGPPLLEAVDLSIERGERVCLLGRNGAGKTTLMKSLIGDLELDAGEVVQAADTRIIKLGQKPTTHRGTVEEVVARGLGALGELLVRRRELTSLQPLGDADQTELARLEEEYREQQAWEAERRLEDVLTGLSLPREKRAAELSGGMRRRVDLARAIVSNADVLLLDEPTNHLDIDAVRWLEAYLPASGRTLLFVSHDRVFVQAIATRIIEIDRGRLIRWPGDYHDTMRRKQHALEVEANHNAGFDRKLAQEEAWIRQGIKARRTRNEGRVRALERLRQQRQERRERPGNVRFRVPEAERSGKLVVHTRDMGFGFEGQPIVQGLTTTILRGDRVGIIGPNGCGKTTLVKLLLGEMEPSSGTVRPGASLQVAYLDQLRAQLHEDRSVAYNVSESGEYVIIDGSKRHVIGYLGDFLFSPDRTREAVNRLSGGERSRLLLARLFTRPSNLLVLDEPTNDLDGETLELLEERVLSYKGTLLLVSHDRALLDNVVTSTLAFEGPGVVREYVGGYSDWLRQRQPAAASSDVATEKKKKKKKKRPAEPSPVKLTYAQRLELEALPAQLEELEARRDGLQEEMATPAFYRQDSDTIGEAMNQLKAMEDELEQLYSRWEELEAIPGS